MDLHQIARADLTGEIESHVQALLKEAFPDSFSKKTDYYSHETPALIWIIRHDRAVIGHLALYERQVKIADELLNIGMIGGVAVASQQRRRGCSRLLIQSAHEYLKRKLIPFSILFAYEPGFYRSSGYRLMENETYFLDCDNTWKTFVFRGGMYAELLDRRWPNQTVDLRGRVV
jgi:predicted acetyltransferase